MNVSREADAAFMRDVEREDQKRFANLFRNMRLAAHKQQQNTEGTAEFAAKMKRWDKPVARRAATTGVLPVDWRRCAYEPCRRPFKPENGNQVFCCQRCRLRGNRNGLIVTAPPSETRINTGD